MEGLSQLRERLFDAWSSASLGGRVVTVLAALLMISTVIGAAVWSSMPDFKLLRDGITPVVTAEIVSVLDANSIPNRMNYSGTGVLVPASRWNEANIAISSISADSNATASSPGNSLFSPQPGHGESVQAREVALQRSLESLRIVKSAVVHLAIPEKSPFRSKRQPPSASVIIEPHAGQMISHEMAMGIIHTVASAVEGLDPKNVMLADAEGGLVGNLGDNDPAAIRREYVRDLEADLAIKAQDHLAAMLGPNRAVVRVTATVDDFLDKVTTKDHIDSADKVRITEKITSSDQQGTAAASVGAAGTSSNDPTALLSGLATEQPISGKTETNETSYDYPRWREETREIGGQIRRLSISATVDNSVAVDESGESTSPSLAQEVVEDLIKTAVGFDAARGDQIEVAMVAFAAVPNVGADSSLPDAQQWAFVAQLAKNASLGLAAIVALLLGMMTLKKMKPIEIRTPSESGNRKEILSELSSRIEGNPEAVSKILAAWISQRQSDDEPSTMPLKKAA